MKIYNYTFYLLFTIFLFGCKEKTDPYKLLETIYVNTKSAKEFDFSNITNDRFSIIPLESNDSCLIAKIDKIEFKNGHIYILDKLAKSIFIFDEDGHYLSKIFRNGNGPGEYIEITDMTIQESNIFVIDKFSQKQIEYTNEGQFLNESRILNRVWAMGLFSLGKKIFYVNEWSNTTNGKFLLFSYDVTDKSINKFLPFEKEPIGLGIDNPIYSMQNNRACLLYSNCDIIYSVSENENAKPKYEVKYLDKKVKYSKDVKKVFSENPPKSILGMNEINESERYLFLNIYTIGEEFNLIYDKTTKQSLTVKDLMHNSLFGDAPSTVWRVCENRLIHYYEPSVQIEQYNSIYKHKKYKSVSYKKQLDRAMIKYSIDDNPILFIYYLKS